MKIARGLVAMLAAALASPALSQSRRADLPPGLERRDDPAVPAPLLSHGRSPAGLQSVAGFVSIQANLDENGMNVVGDAANEPSLAVDPTAPNRIAIGWRQFDTIESNFRQAGFAFSRDGGRTWSPKSVIEPGVFRSDPVLGASSDGRIHYLSLTITPRNEFLTDLFTSEDGGQTWPERSFAFGGDKQWLAIDRTGGPSDGNMYQAWNTAGNEFFPAQFNRSLDAGATWDEPVQFDPPDGARPVFGTVAVGPAGEVYVAGGPNGTSTDMLWVARSDDAMDPGTPTFDVSTIAFSPGRVLLFGFAPNPGGLLGQVGVVVDRSGGSHHGTVYVLAQMRSVFEDSARVDLGLLKSTDGGQTWSDPIRVNDSAKGFWRWFGTMSVAPNGRIDVVFNDDREGGGEPNLTRTYYTFSTDGGQTWSDDEPISPQWDSWVGWPKQNKIGDYYDMVSDRVGAHLIYATTFNGEQDVYYLRINDYDCNDNGVGDEQDIASGAAGDCNDNGIPDSCEIAAGTADDADGDGVPDSCLCEADLTGPGDDGVPDGSLTADDFFFYLGLLADGDSAADLTGPGGDGVPDGELTADDFFFYLGLFSDGCG